MRLYDAVDDGAWTRQRLLCKEVRIFEALLWRSYLPEAGVTGGLRVDGIDHGGNGRLNDQQLATAASSDERLLELAQGNVPGQPFHRSESQFCVVEVDLCGQNELVIKDLRLTSLVCSCVSDLDP